jgi:hypothetical protein
MATPEKRGYPMASERKPYSRFAIAGLVFGILCLTPLGLLAPIFGGIGLWQTRGNRRRGRGIAQWGFGLGLVSVWVTATGIPMSFYPLPVQPRDSAVQKFFDELATPGPTPDLTGVHVANAPGKDTAAYARWKEAFNREVGKGHMLCVEYSGALDDMRVYRVRFEKAGVTDVPVYADPDKPRWVMFLLGTRRAKFPQPGELKFSDKYHSDPHVIDEPTTQGRSSH